MIDDDDGGKSRLSRMWKWWVGRVEMLNVYGRKGQNFRKWWLSD